MLSSFYSPSCRERRSGKSKQTRFWSRTSGQIGISKLYLAVLLPETTFNEPSSYFIGSILGNLVNRGNPPRGVGALSVWQAKF